MNLIDQTPKQIKAYRKRVIGQIISLKDFPYTNNDKLNLFVFYSNCLKQVQDLLQQKKFDKNKVRLAANRFESIV